MKCCDWVGSCQILPSSICKSIWQKTKFSETTWLSPPYKLDSKWNQQWWIGLGNRNETNVNIRETARPDDKYKTLGIWCIIIRKLYEQKKSKHITFSNQQWFNWWDQVSVSQTRYYLKMSKLKSTWTELTESLNQK